MIRLKEYLKLIRIKHWLKNIFILFPMFFGGEMLNLQMEQKVWTGVIAFSMLTSVVYILNDICDKEKDRLHAKKKNRPIASGKISELAAAVVAAVMFVVAIVLNFVECAGWKGWSIFIAYFIINIGYSCFKWKNIPILDVTILVSGFVLRLTYGAVIAGIPISEWLFLTVISGAFYMALGKRRNEIGGGALTREVLKYYSVDFLSKNMYMCLAVTIVFYSLWCLDFTASVNPNCEMIWTIPLLMVMAIRYSYIIEDTVSDGDPIEVILTDKVLLLMGTLYVIILSVMLYVYVY